MAKTRLSDEEVAVIINSWIDRVSEKRAELNGWSICPFASKKVTWKTIIIDELNFDSICKSKDHEEEIVVFTSGNAEPNFDTLDSIAIALNKEFPELVFLPDHVLKKTYIKDIETGNQHLAVIIMQKKDKLFRAREALEKTDYYSLWGEEFLIEIKKYGN